MIQCSVFKVRGILKNMKIQTELLHLRHDFFCKLYTLGRLVIYTFTFRYSLASRAFPKAKYSVVCTEKWVQNFIFPNGEFIFPNPFSVKNT